MEQVRPIARYSEDCRPDLGMMRAGCKRHSRQFLPRRESSGVQSIDEPTRKANSELDTIHFMLARESM